MIIKRFYYSQLEIFELCLLLTLHLVKLPNLGLVVDLMSCHL